MPQPQPSLRSILTPRVILCTVNYALLSLVDISFRCILPVFYSSPASLGGLEFSPQTIGICLSVFGVLNGVFLVSFFARLSDLFGPKRIFVGTLLGSLPMVACFPIMSALVKWRAAQGQSGIGGTVWALIVVQLALSMGMNMAFSASDFLLSIHAFLIT